MRKFVVMMVLVMISSSAMAEWTETYRDDKGTDYVNLSSVRKSGNKVKMWILIDYAARQPIRNDMYLSSVFLEEFDCSEFANRTVSRVDYSKNMGDGDVVNSWIADYVKWRPVMPDTIGELRTKIACSLHKVSGKK